MYGAHSIEKTNTTKHTEIILQGRSTVTQRNYGDERKCPPTGRFSCSLNCIDTYTRRPNCGFPLIPPNVVGGKYIETIQLSRNRSAVIDGADYRRAPAPQLDTKP